MIIPRDLEVGDTYETVRPGTDEIVFKVIVAKFVDSFGRVTIVDEVVTQ